MEKKLNILVTGANGFIGSHILKYLSGKNEYYVRGMVRRTSNLFRVIDDNSKNYQLVYSSLDEPLESILDGIDVVINTIGKATYWGKYEEFYKTNVEGTKKLLQACLKNGVRRFIHISSATVYGFGGNRNTSEDKQLKPFKNNYCITKKLAEEEVFYFKDKLEVYIFRPATVFGPEDTALTYNLFSSLERGLKFFPCGGISLTSPCYVKNLASAVELAVNAEKDLQGTYNISDGMDIPWKDFLALMAGEIGSKPPAIPVPAFPIYLCLRLGEMFRKLSGIKSPPLIVSPLIAQVRKDFSFSIEKIKTHLGFVPLYCTEEGVKESAKWYLSYKKEISSG